MALYSYSFLLSLQPFLFRHPSISIFSFQVSNTYLPVGWSVYVCTFVCACILCGQGFTWWAVSRQWRPKNINASENNNMIASWLLKKNLLASPKNCWLPKKFPRASWPLEIEYRFIRLYEEYFFWLLNEVAGDQNKNFGSQIGSWIILLATKMIIPGASWPRPVHPGRTLVRAGTSWNSILAGQVKFLAHLRPARWDWPIHWVLKANYDKYRTFCLRPLFDYYWVVFMGRFDCSNNL